MHCHLHRGDWNFHLTNEKKKKKYFPGQLHCCVPWCLPPPPSRKNKLTNEMFLEKFTDLNESYVACDRLFVVGDLNVHFDNPSDPCTAALNTVLANLSLEQLVNVPTHRRGHTLDWLITNRTTYVLDLTVADMFYQTILIFLLTCY